MTATIETISKKIDGQTTELPTATNTTTEVGKNNDRLIKKVVEKLKCGLQFLWKDLTKKHLLWVKIIFFLQSASLVTLYPYLTIHLKSLGYTIEDASLVNSVIPVADIFGPPLAGFLADKLGNFRLFMAILTLLNGASSLLLLAIPPVFISGQFNETIGDSIVANSSVIIEHFNEDLGVGIVANNWLTEAFWSYLTVRVLLDVLRASSLMLFEGAVVSIIKQHGGDYGLQKLFGTFGAVIFGPLSGVLIDFGHDYSGVIILYFCLRAATALCILKLDLNFKPKGKKVLRNLSYVLCQVEVLAFLFAFLMAGILWGYLENFLFWHLEDLGATKFLMGISLAIGTLAGVPLTMFSTLIIKNLGHHKIVIFALVLYGIRLFGYAELSQAETFLAFEVAKPFCTTLLLISVMTFVKDNIPLTTMATVEAVFGSSYFGVGRGLGGLVGGFAIEAFGNVTSFRLFGAVSLASAGIYTLVIALQKLYKSRKYVVQDSV